MWRPLLACHEPSSRPAAWRSAVRGGALLSVLVTLARSAPTSAACVLVSPWAIASAWVGGSSWGASEGGGAAAAARCPRLVQGAPDSTLGAPGRLCELAEGLAGAVVLVDEREQRCALLWCLSHAGGAAELRQDREGGSAGVGHCPSR